MNDTFLTRGGRLAVVYLFALSLALAAANLAWTGHEVRAAQAAQARAGHAVEQKLCSTFGRLAVLRPPAGNPRKYPSRSYEQQVHATLAQLGADLGCK